MKKVIFPVVLLLAACTGAPPGTAGVVATSAAAAPTAGGAVAPAAATAAAAAGATGPAREFLLLPPNCRAPATPTTASTEGPFFKAGSPERASLVTAGMAGTRIQLFGFVVTRSCAPVAGAKVDIWQADANGNYDNTGYTLRGHVFTDKDGRYSIQTIVPGRYPGRTPHIHVKIIATGAPELTTQLYMPNEASNASDSIFRPELTVTLNAPGLATFTFIIDKP